MTQYIILAHNGDIDGPANWTVQRGAHALRAAQITAERWQKQGWEYVSIRPVGDPVAETEEVAA
jgi:hypothetical protein